MDEAGRFLGAHLLVEVEGKAGEAGEARLLGEGAEKAGAGAAFALPPLPPPAVVVSHEEAGCGGKEGEVAMLMAAAAAVVVHGQQQQQQQQQQGGEATGSCGVEAAAGGASMPGVG